MDNWDEIRMAYHVARIGTVSGAAEFIGVHHATVIRNIDALEKSIGTKLFQRHTRGYTPTEAGVDLLRIAHTADDQFSQLAGRIRGQSDKVSGELVVTSLANFSHILTPILIKFQSEHPDLSVRYLAGSRLFKLEYGEAHVAIRAGAPPDQPDNIVQKLPDETVAIYGSKAYIKANGMPASAVDLHAHRFVSFDKPNLNAPFNKWLADNIEPEQIMFRVLDIQAYHRAVIAGAGLGFIAESVGKNHEELVEVLPPRPEWVSQRWLVTHVDLHHTTKVQTFLSFLKAELAA